MNLEEKRDEMYRLIASRLPKRFIYFATIELWAKTTSGEYGNINPSELKLSEALDMYVNKYKLHQL